MPRPCFEKPESVSLEIRRSGFVRSTALPSPCPEFAIASYVPSVVSTTSQVPAHIAMGRIWCHWPKVFRRDGFCTVLVVLPMFPVGGHRAS